MNVFQKIALGFAVLLIVGHLSALIGAGIMWAIDFVQSLKKESE